MPTWRVDSRIGRYGLAVLAVMAAALCRWLLVALDLGANTTFGPFYAATVLAALYGGFGAGLLALGLSAAATIALWATEPARSTIAPVSIVVFLMVGGLIVWLTHLTRTARVRAEHAEHRVQSVLDSITDAFVAIDFSWRFTYVNEAAYTYFHKPAGSLIGRKCWEVFPNAIGTAVESYFRQVMERREAGHGGVAVGGEAHALGTAAHLTQCRRYLGGVPRHHRTAEPATGHPPPSGATASRPRGSPHGRVGVRPASSIASPTAHRPADVLGVPSERLPHDRQMGTDLIHPDDREGHVAIVRRASRSAEGQYRSQYRLADEYLFGRPGPVWIEDRGRMLFDAVGQLTLLQGVLQDVTSQRATEEHIRALNESLHERVAERQSLLEAAEASREAAERSSRAKDEFLAVLSHELRSPMQSVLGWVQVLRSTPLEAEPLAAPSTRSSATCASSRS